MTYLTERVINNLGINELYSFPISQEENGLPLKDDTYKLIFSFGTECNLSCSYCYEKNNVSKCISFDDFKNALDHINIDDYSSLYIEFRGGEPLLRFKLMKQCIEYAESLPSANKIKYYFITNGVLLSPAAIDYFNKIDSGKVLIALSIDGSSDVHNPNRSNSLDLINFEALKEVKFKIKISCTVTPLTIKYLEKSLSFLCSLGYPIRTHVDFDSHWEENVLTDGFNRFINLLEGNNLSNQLNKLLIFNKGQLLSYGKHASSIDENMCGTGETRSFINGDGLVSPCQLLEGVDINGFKVKNPDKCLHCNMFYLCQKCYGYSYKKNKSFEVALGFCEIMRLKTIALACYWAAKIKNKPKHLVNPKIKQSIVNILQTEEKIGFPVVKVLSDKDEIDKALNILCESLDCSASSLKKSPQKQNYVLSIEQSGKKVGYLLLIDNHIRLLYVEPKYQKQGFGTKLISAAIDFLKNISPSFSQITVVSKNETVGFYLTNGFKIFKESQEGNVKLIYDLQAK